MAFEGFEEAVAFAVRNAISENRPLTTGSYVEIPEQISYNNQQYGPHSSKHMPEWGLDVRNATDRATFRSIIENIFYNFDEVRQGPFNPQGGGGGYYFFFRLGNDIVVTKNSGEFVSIWRGLTNPHWIGAQPINTGR